MSLWVVRLVLVLGKLMNPGPAEAKCFSIPEPAKQIWMGIEFSEHSDCCEALHAVPLETGGLTCLPKIGIG